MNINQKGAARLITAHGDIWAIQPDAFAQLTHSAADEWEPVIPQARELAATGRGASSGKGTMVIPVVGTLTHRRGWGCGTSYVELSKMIDDALGHKGIGTLVFEFDTPGGGVAGLPEASKKIAYAGQFKKTIAMVNTLSASAGYHLASQCSEVVLTQSGEVGSIGVWCAHADYSKALDKEGVTVSIVYSGRYKVEGHPYAALDEEARKHMQRRVDDIHAEFVAAVAKGRRRSEEFVRNHFGQGRTVTAELASASGMVDKIGTLEATIQRAMDPRTDREIRQATLRRKLQMAAAWDPLDG